MLIDKELIVKAKQKLGEDAASIIAKDLQIQEWDEKNLKGCCPFHGEETASFIWNSKESFFKCFGCSKVYGIIDHYMKFYNFTYLGAVEKLFEITETEFRFGERGVRKNRDYRYPSYDKEENRNEVEKYLELRKISKETLDYCDIQQLKNAIVFNFYDESDVLTLVKYRPARQVKSGESKSWCQSGADSKNILYNMNRIDPSKPLVIVEGEIDCLSVVESGFLNCVSIPLGAGNMKWIEENWDWLEQFEKIIIWFDIDEPGTKARKEACQRLGIYRTLFVEIPEDLTLSSSSRKTCKDANEVLYAHGKDKVLELLANAQEMPLTGAIDLSKVDDFDIETAPGLFPGLKDLEDIVMKFLFGNVIVVTGQRGSGKSTLLNQLFICETLEQGYDAFVFSGELAPPILKSWMELTMAGPEAVKMKEGSKFVHVINKDAKVSMREWYENRVWIYNQKQNTAQEILDVAVATTRKYGTKVWILDNLSTIDIGANDNNLNEKQKWFIVELIRLAALYGVLIVLVVHPRKTMAGAELNSDDVGGSGALTNLAQYVISVKRFSKNSSPAL